MICGLCTIFLNIELEKNLSTNMHVFTSNIEDKMSERMEIDARMSMTEDKEMDQKGSELREGGMTDQMTVTMTDKSPAWSTSCKGKNKEASLSELGSSPTGSFQSLQSSQSSEGGSGMSMNPLVWETRMLKSEDTLSKKDCENFKLTTKFNFGNGIG